MITDFMEAFVFMNKTKTPDGEGGSTTSWAQGSTQFQAAVTLDSSMQARVAESQGVANVYTVTVLKSVNLEFHDVIKRVSDGKIFRITSDGEDNKTPSMSALNIRQVSAEKWELSS